MEMPIVLHEGTVVGPQVATSFSWSSDYTILTVVPAGGLKSKTTYVVHLSPNLEDASGRGVNYAGCAQRVGGQPLSTGMIGGGMMGSDMMGSGRRRTSGTWGYGMTLMFTTA